MKTALLPQIQAASQIIRSWSFWGDHSWRHVGMSFWRDVKMEEAEKTLKEVKLCF